MEILQIIWFALAAVLLAAVFITCGFDFGAGVIFGLLRSGKQKSFILKNIIPFWDANQVWFITAGGALFAAFPKAYSAVLSSMYTPVMLLLACIILRVTSIEFYSHAKTNTALKLWGRALFVTSALTPVLLGVALGAIYGGAVILPADGFLQSFTKIFTPLSIAAGALSLAFFAAHGATFIALKSEGDEDFNLYALIARRALLSLSVFYMIYLVVFVLINSTVLSLIMVAASYVPLSISMKLAKYGRFKTAFLCNSLFAAILVFAHAISAFPYIIPPLGGLTNGLLIEQAASSDLTLKIMLGVALVGVPLAIIYNAYAHMVFSKKNDKRF